MTSTSPSSLSQRNSIGLPTSPFLRLFFYGSLRKRCLNHHLLYDYFGEEIVFERLVTTTIPGYLLSLMNKDYPYLTFSPPTNDVSNSIKGAHVIGETYLVPSCHPGLLKLDELEDEYSAVEIDVRTLDDTFTILRAQAYLIDSKSMLTVDNLWLKVISKELFLVENGDWISVGRKEKKNLKEAEEKTYSLVQE